MSISRVTFSGDICSSVHIEYIQSIYIWNKYFRRLYKHVRGEKSIWELHLIHVISFCNIYSPQIIIYIVLYTVKLN